MSSPDFIWSKATYSVTKLMAKYSSNFPIIVMVTNGYYGKYDLDTLATAQIARLHTWGVQERVIAQDSRGREISIPKDYEIEFEVMDKKKSKKSKNSKPMKLQNIIKAHDLPVTVQFSRKQRWNFRIGSQRYSTRDFGPLELNRVYQERFLKGNTIHNGIIDTKVMLLPMYVKVRFKVAQGVKGVSDEEWLSLQLMYTKAISHIKFDNIHGTKDMTEYLAKQHQTDQGNFSEDEIDGEEEVLNGKDANANYTSVENKEARAHIHVNGDIRREPNVNTHREVTQIQINGDLQKVDNRGDNIEEDDLMMKIPMSGKLLMQVTKDDIERSSEPARSELDYRGMFRSDMSDISSVSNAPNVVRVNLTSGMDSMPHSVRSYEVSGRDRYTSPTSTFHRSGPISTFHGSTIINVANDDQDTEIIQPLPQHNNTFNFSDSNTLRRTFSDIDINDNSVFLHSSQPYINEIPSYATGRRSRGSHPSFSSSDSRGVRYLQNTNHGKYGQRILGGAPLPGDRRYHSMSNLSRLDQVDSGISRTPSFRSAVMVPSPASPSRHKPNLYLRIADEDDVGHHSTHTNRSSNTTYVRRAGVERATIAAVQASPHRPKHREQHQYNQKVFVTDGIQNYAVSNRKKAPRPPPPSYDSLDYVELIEEDYTQSNPSVWNSPNPRQRSIQPLISPGQSSSSNEDSKRYFVMYDNGPGHREVKEATDDFVYQGSMTLRRNEDEEEVLDIPVADMRTKSNRSKHWSMQSDSVDIPVHNVMDRTVVERSERRVPSSSSNTSHSEVRRILTRDYDTTDLTDNAINTSLDMTRTAADHYGNMMENKSAYTRHRVPVEIENRSSINESMFEGGHHSHSFTKDRNVCQRLERSRMLRSTSHRDNLRNMERMQNDITPYNITNITETNTRLPDTRVGYAANMANHKADRYSTSYSLRSNNNEVIATDNNLLASKPLFINEAATNYLLDSAPQIKIHGPSVTEHRAFRTERSPSASSYSDSSSGSQHGGFQLQEQDDEDERGQGSYDFRARRSQEVRDIIATDVRRSEGSRPQSTSLTETSYTIKSVPVEVVSHTKSSHTGSQRENKMIESKQDSARESKRDDMGVHMRDITREGNKDNIYVIRRDSKRDSKRDSEDISRRDSKRDSKRDIKRDSEDISRRDSKRDSKRDRTRESREISRGDSKRDSIEISRRDSKRDSRRDSKRDNKRDSLERDSKRDSKADNKRISGHTDSGRHRYERKDNLDVNRDLSGLDNYETKENKYHIQGNERISRKRAREITKSGSVRSLREVYARSRSPSVSDREVPTMTVAPTTEVFSDILNKPTSATTVQTTTTRLESGPRTTSSTNSIDAKVIMRKKTKPSDLNQKDGKSNSTSRIEKVGRKGEALSWQETQSIHLENIRDSIRDLDEYLKDQGADTDSHSLSSATSSKHMEHFSYALKPNTKEATTF